jgi:SAM-dependent methyltransferase
MNSNDVKKIQDSIQNKYAEVSKSANEKFDYVTGKIGAIALGYTPSVIENAPEELLISFCGVSNPFSLGKIRLGEAIIDVGCGAGFDLYVASLLVGPKGRACGIDLTPEMIGRAKSNLALANTINTEVQLSTSESIPYEDNSFDVAISNGVLNLSPLKEKSFDEIYRVIKPGGRLQFGDIVLKEGVEPANVCNIDSWAQ